MRTLRTIVVAALVLAAVVAALPAPAEAQGYSTGRRGGSWEFMLPLIYSDTATIEGQGGANVKINSDWGFGFGFGYNITDNFNVNGIFNWATRSYEATRASATAGLFDKYNNYLETSTFMLSGVYYILEGSVTPFVTGGVGITYVDTNIQTGATQGYCWWDPWWGYVCSSYVPTKTENDMSYSAGLGVRIDATRQFGMQFSYNKMWIDVSKAASTPDFDNWRFDLLFRM